MTKTNAELAEEIERLKTSSADYGYAEVILEIKEPLANAIIAALRSGPERVVYQCPRCATSMEVDPTAKPSERPPSGEMVRSFLEQFKAASEERWQFLSECEREAAKYRSRGDMWGWNFHMGMSSGANQADLMYQRVYRAMLSAAEAEGRKGD